MKEIERPKINFNFLRSDKCYLENDLFVIINNLSEEKFYLTKTGMQHRLDGHAAIFCYDKYFYIYGIYRNNLEFAKETKHLVCKLCYDFCKQKCFL